MLVNVEVILLLVGLRYSTHTIHKSGKKGNKLSGQTRFSLPFKIKLFNPYIIEEKQQEDAKTQRPPMNGK